MNAASSKGPVFDPGLCRCCGTMRKCRLLTAEYENPHFGKEIYSDMIMDCFGLVLSYLDSKPTERLICANCVRRLRDASAFRKQVLQCEQAFLQVRMADKVEEEPIKTTLPCTAVDGRINIEVVKVEPGSPMFADDQDDEDSLMETVEEIVPVKPKDKPEVNKVIPDAGPKMESSKRIAKPKPAPLPTQSTKKLPMSKLQQIIRERDTSYMTLTNILTIVEYSYVLPFRCRHNNLLCYYCGELFTEPSPLRQHTETAHNPNKFKINEKKHILKCDITRIDCRLCSEKIENLEDFKKHVNSVHNKPYYFDYKDSILPFKLKKDDLKCALCDDVFPFFHALNKHMNEHFSNYVCETCGLGFVDIGRFMMHQQRHEEADYPCPECGKNFKAQYNRDLHIDRIHRKKGRVYCPKCDVMLMSYHQKLKHLVEIHGEAPMSFPCSMCDRVLDSRRSLTIHRRKDHLKDYRFECQCCGQRFFTKFALNNHMPTHTGERNYKCKVCDKSYPRLKTLKEHVRIHTNDRRYRCHVCGQAFIQNCSLKGHMKSQHPEYG